MGCGGKKIKQKTEVKNDMTLSQEKRDNVGKYLFNADEMESIEISGKDLRNGVVFVELVEGKLQLSGRILAADASAGSVHPLEDVQQRRLIRAVGRYLIPD